jgi:hypothetical protein
MKPECDQQADELGLLANGSCGRWDVAVDESLEGDKWFLEIEGPRTYLVFQLRDLAVIPKLLRFLQSGPGLDSPDEKALGLGEFGAQSVCLSWENEEIQRCFLIIGPNAGFCLRLTFEEEDIQMLREALVQVVEELPTVAEK